MAARRRSALAVTMYPLRGHPLARLPPGQCVVPAADLLDDGVWVGGPHERPRIPVVLLDEAVDRLLQGHQRGEAAAPEAPTGQLGEKVSTALSQEQEVGVKWKVQRG